MRILNLRNLLQRKLIEIEPENSGSYILLSNIYATAGRWKDVARIRAVLSGKGMKKVPGYSQRVLLEMEEEWKEGALRHHSEKLAILTVVKNLSMCRNCHEATKLMSKIYKMEIVARERTRFHHFCNIPSCYI
ncbi:unnamed protein product [Brassica oleracea]|nr:unnamed protein product [Brassica oleracea]